MILEKYPSYKDSGFEWLSEIPSHWKVRRVKDIAKINPNTYKSGNIGDSDKIEFLPMNQVDEAEGRIKKFLFESYANVKSGYTAFKNGDILFAKITPCMENGNCVIVKNLRLNLGFGSTEFIIFRTKFKFRKFLYSFLRNRRFLEKAEYFMTGSAGQKRISSSYLEVHPIGIPTEKEQIQISNFLDKKTSQIDQKINILQDKKTSYEELKKSLINETVCRGINKNAELKEANANWVGKIPSHWNVGRLKNIFEKRIEKNLRVDGAPVTTNILSVMKDIGVINHRDKGNVGNKMSEDITGYKLVYPKDIVVNKMNVLIGSVGISKEFGALSVIYIILKTKSKNSPEYYDYVFRSKYFQKYLRTISTGILEIRECVNSNLFRHQEIPQPLKHEQIQIAKYLDEKTSKIDEIISKIKDQITTLTEFRKTIINDVVTGKVRVQHE